MTELLNIDELDTPELIQEITTPVMGVKEIIKLTPTQDRRHIIQSEDAWGWEELRDYVVTEIESRFGPFPRDSRKESGIFKSFISRWGDQAPIIAKVAFEAHDGYWKGAPISVTRFCKGSDPYFASIIADKI